MAFFGILVVLAVLSIPAGVIYLLVRVADLRARLTRLEADLRDLALQQPVPREVPAAPEAASAVAAPPEVPEEALLAPPLAEAAAAPPEALDVEEAAAVPPEPEPAVAPRPPVVVLPWLRDNWIYAVSAVSLGLAGIFLVQYGIERGLLTPAMRVLMAMAFGGALVGAGEYIRRRWGDDEGASTAFLPSTFSAAGLVVLYAAVLAARGLYGLIGPEAAFAGFVAVSAVAVVFGWFYGPFLAAAGLGGAAVAPFLTGGEADSGTLFYLYYGLLGAAALVIDAMRRWGWVSYLGLALAFGFGTLVHLSGGEQAGYAALMLWLALAAIALPRLQLWPTHPGEMLLESLSARRSEPLGIIPPTRIAASAVAAATALVALASLSTDAGGQVLSFGILAVLTLALSVWAWQARALADLTLLPALAFLGLIVLAAWGWTPLYADFLAFDPALNPETAPPTTATMLVVLAALCSAGAAWRSGRGPYPAIWAAGAAAFAPAAAIALELFWTPAPVIGAYFWAGHSIALAALMTLLAERFARADGEDRRRAAYAVLAALVLIALALFAILSKAALTVALAVLVAAAAAIDRRFRLPELRWALLAGVAVLGWRLILDPGLPAYLDLAPLSEVVLAFGAALAGLAAAMRLLPAEGRGDSRALLESALWGYGGVFLTILLWRFVSQYEPAMYRPLTHWSASLFAMMWTGLAAAQLWRLRHAAHLRLLRQALALGYGAAAIIGYGLALTALNPFLSPAEELLGPPLVDTLLLAYGLPALLMAGLALRARWLPHARHAVWPAGVFAILWVFLEIRRFWHPELHAGMGFAEGELYAYTVALLLTGAGLLYQAIARQSTPLRRLAMAVIGFTVLKVFLVDAAGLAGLLRVFSFLALGLSLAALAWLNRWAAGRQVAAPPAA